MIDYVKILLLGIDIERLENTPKLDFEIIVGESTGDIKSTKKVANYHYCKIEIHDSSIVIFKGSIHKMWNSLNSVFAPNYNKKKPYTGYNGNQFPLNAIIQIRTHLQRLFDCRSNQMKFQNIELGLNLPLNFKPKLFIRSLLYQKGEMFEHKHKRYFAKVPHQEYELKIYDKSNQYKMVNKTLRVEIKIKKSRILKLKNIETFEDISYYTLNSLKDLLLERFSEIVYYDETIKKERLTKRQKQSLEKYSNPRYWIDELKPNDRYRPRKALNKIIVEHSDNLKEKIIAKIEENWNKNIQNTELTECSIITTSSIELNILQNNTNLSELERIEDLEPRSNNFTRINNFFRAFFGEFLKTISLRK